MESGGGALESTPESTDVLGFKNSPVSVKQSCSCEEESLGGVSNINRHILSRWGDELWECSTVWVVVKIGKHDFDVYMIKCTLGICLATS